MDEFNDAWSGSKSARLSLVAFGDDGDGAAEFFGGSLEGPYLFGPYCRMLCLWNQTDYGTQAKVCLRVQKPGTAFARVSGQST